MLSDLILRSPSSSSSSSSSSLCRYRRMWRVAHTCGAKWMLLAWVARCFSSSPNYASAASWRSNRWSCYFRPKISSYDAESHLHQPWCWQRSLSCHLKREPTAGIFKQKAKPTLEIDSEPWKNWAALWSWLAASQNSNPKIQHFDLGQVRPEFI